MTGVGKLLLLARAQSMWGDLPNQSTVSLKNGQSQEMEKERTLIIWAWIQLGHNPVYLGVPDCVSSRQLELDFLLLTIDRVLTITNSFRTYLLGSISKKISLWFISVWPISKFFKLDISHLISKVTQKKHIQGFIISASGLVALIHMSSSGNLCKFKVCIIQTISEIWVCISFNMFCYFVSYF